MLQNGIWYLVLHYTFIIFTGSYSALYFPILNRPFLFSNMLCIHSRLCVYVCVCIYVYVCVLLCMFMTMRQCLYMWLSLCLSMCMCVSATWVPRTRVNMWHLSFWVYFISLNVKLYSHTCFPLWLHCIYLPRFLNLFIYWDTVTLLGHVFPHYYTCWYLYFCIVFS